jgi:multidrug resistance efflux pump
MKKLVRTIAIGVVAGIAVWFGGHYGWRWWTDGRFLETTATPMSAPT